MTLEVDQQQDFTLARPAHEVHALRVSECERSGRIAGQRPYFAISNAPAAQLKDPTVPRKPMSLADQLRIELLRAEKSGLTRYRISKASGIGQSTLSEFVNSDRQLRLDIAERIANVLGKKLVLTDQAE